MCGSQPKIVVPNCCARALLNPIVTHAHNFVYCYSILNGFDGGKMITKQYNLDIIVIIHMYMFGRNKYITKTKV